MKIVTKVKNNIVHIENLDHRDVRSIDKKQSH